MYIWRYPPVSMGTHFMLRNIGKWVFLHNFVNFNAIEAKLGSNEMYCHELYYYWILVCKWAHLHIPNLHICPFFVHFYNSRGKITHVNDDSCHNLLYACHILLEACLGHKKKRVQMLSWCTFEYISQFLWKHIWSSILENGFSFINLVYLNAIEVKLGSNKSCHHKLCYKLILTCYWAHMYRPNLRICHFFCYLNNAESRLSFIILGVE